MSSIRTAYSYAVRFLFFKKIKTLNTSIPPSDEKLRPESPIEALYTPERAKKLALPITALYTPERRENESEKSYRSALYPRATKK